MRTGDRLEEKVTKHDIAGELTTYGMRVGSCVSDERIKEVLEELRREIPKWKKQLNKEE